MTLFWLGILWLAGIRLAPFTNLTSGEWLIISTISFLSVLLFRHRKNFQILYLSILVVTLGAARYQTSIDELSPEDIGWYNDTETYATITGLVVKPPDVRDTYIGLSVETETLRFGSPGSSFDTSGRILVRASRFDDWAYGDRVLIQGFLETPPAYETFNYKDYLVSHGRRAKETHFRQAL